jgi:surface protein
MIEAQELIVDISSNELVGELGKTIQIVGPSGNIDITSNGTYDITNYASANVNVPKPTPNFISFYYSPYQAIDVSWFDISNITNMRYMFSSCEQLLTLDLSSWNTSNVTDMSSMFRNCRRITSLDLRNFVAVSGGTYTSMFTGCPQLETLRLDKFDFRNVSTSISNMFSQVPRNCRVYVLDQYAKDLFTNASFTNVEIAS